MWEFCENTNILLKRQTVCFNTTNKSEINIDQKPVCKERDQQLIKYLAKRRPAISDTTTHMHLMATARVRHNITMKKWKTLAMINKLKDKHYCNDKMNKTWQSYISRNTNWQLMLYNIYN